MTNQVDNWQKLARYDTNIQGELHANLLKNNGIAVSVQVLSAIPGMNSGAVLWVQEADLTIAQGILANIDTGNDTDRDVADGSDDPATHQATNSDNGGNR